MRTPFCIGRIEIPPVKEPSKVAEQLKALLSKASFPAFVDLNSSHFQFEDESFLTGCPNVIKE